MYHVQIEVAKQQSGRIHLGRESYRKAKDCRLLSGAARVVATAETALAKGARTERARAQTSRPSTGHQRDLVCAVDGLSVESGQARVVWRVQHDDPSALSGVASQRRV